MPCYGDIPCKFCGGPTAQSIKSIQKAITLIEKYDKLQIPYNELNYQWLDSVVILGPNDNIIEVGYNHGLSTGISVNGVYYNIREYCFLHQRCLEILKRADTERMSIFYRLRKTKIPWELTFGPIADPLSEEEQKNGKITRAHAPEFHCQECISECIKKLYFADCLWMYYDPKNPKNIQQRKRLLEIIKVLYKEN